MTKPSPVSAKTVRALSTPRWLWYLLACAGLIFTVLLAVLFLGGYTTRVPEGLQPVPSFDIDRYLGKWYEIARLDHSFERGLQNVMAEYQAGPDGTIVVLNRGYNTARGRWEEIEGKAQFVGDHKLGSLKVSFFGPFYGGYHVIALDRDYRYAMLTGPSRRYLWILAREHTLPEDVTQGLLHQAKLWGFDTDRILRVNHTPPPSPAVETKQSPDRRPAPGR